MEEPGPVGAGHDAVAAADAPLPVDEDDSVGRLVGGADGADLHAGRIVALVAELRHEVRLVDRLGIDGKLTALVQIEVGSRIAVPPALGAIGVEGAVLGQHVPLHPRARGVDLVRDVVLQLARLHAEPAADAALGVDQEDPAHGLIRLDRLQSLRAEHLQGGHRDQDSARDDRRLLEELSSGQHPGASCDQGWKRRNCRLALCGSWQVTHVRPTLWRRLSVWHPRQSARVSSMSSLAGSVGWLPA